MNTTKTWKRIVSILMAVLMLLSITPVSTYMDIRSNAATNTKTIFLKANSNYWGQAGAWFVAWAWQGSGSGSWYTGRDDNGDGVYAFTVPSNVDKIIFIRMSNTATAPDHSNGVWNKTGDLTISGNYYSITNWNGGTWSTQHNYIVVGSQELTGSNWSTTDTNNKMTANSDGTYSKTYSNVAAGSYEYKIVGNGEWMWDGSNDTVNVTQTSNVTITFNPSTNAYTAKVDAVATNYSVTFELTNVTKTNGNTTATGGTQYTATLAASSGYTLPDSITVKAGSTTLTSGTHYSYNSSTGAIIINGSAITGNLTITAEGAVAEARKLYLKPGPWANDSPRFAAYFFNDSTGANTWVSMYDSNGDGVYECETPAGYPSVIFVRMNPATSENNWDNDWNQTNNLTVPTDDKNCYEITGYGASGQNSNGQWIAFTEDTGGNGGSVEHIDEITLNPDNVFYVDTDIVDYLNDNRVYNNQVKGYYTNNQGISNDSGYSPFSYLNYLIATEVSHQNSTVPLYFGSLNYIGCRYGRIVGEDTRHGLGNWSTLPNVALAFDDGGVNTDAVVQGLVGSQLVGGTLADPSTGKPLIYFNKTAADEWTNEGHSVMAYYDGLLFPFVKEQIANNVTKYSYDSAKDYAVYYDYANSQLYASSTKVLDSTLDGNSNADDYGFYPLNKPGDKDGALNHGFGAKFNINFTVGENGKLSNGEDVTFEFTGDDDVWVFIDGVLVLDMGGAHSMATGSINFASLSATVNDACTMEDSYFYTSGDSHNYNSYVGNGLPNYIYDGDGQERAKASTAAITKTFSELGLTFDYGKTHTMTVFYMERAGIESNFSMEFTMVPVPSGLTLSKELNDKEINAGLLGAISNVSDYDFNFVATSPSDASVAFQSFTLTNKQTGEVTLVTPNGNSSTTAYSAAIQGITNYTYAHSFFTENGEHAFIPGTQFSITESTQGIFDYSSTTWKVYDAKNGFAETNYKGTGQEATFTMGSAEENTSYSYAVVFTNNMALGTLQISKVFNDPFLKDTAFTFQVYLDLDGNGSTFSEQLYNKLVYTVDGGEPITSSDGTVSITGGQTAVISGIPANASYRVVEVVSEDDPWTVTSSNSSGTISAGGTKTATFTNTTKSNTQDKVIFVEAGTATPYSPTYKDQAITITSLSNATDGLTATMINDGAAISVTCKKENTVYTVIYNGRLPNGEIITGTITVYTYAATHKTYVFDFGLNSNLADIEHGSGLFQGGAFYNSANSNTTATLISLVPAAGNKQTTVSAPLNETIGTNGNYSDIIFSPVAFMSQVETYTYTVRITAKGKTYDANNPETGTIVTGTIKVMPANAVYYEDNFNKGGSNDPDNKIIYSNGGPSSALPNSMVQSNDQSSNYGYDPIYNGGYAQSAGSATTLTNGQFAYFTFHGTGFDLISRTNGSTAGFAVYVFTGGHTQAKQDYMNKFSGATPADMVFVDTYYNNGDLHQVPVVSVRLDSYGEYTVYIQALATRVGDVALPDITDVSIDGIRIYDPLADTSLYPLKTEQNTTIDELRVLYGVNNIVSLAGRDDDGVFNGLGKGERVENALESASIVEDMKGEVISSANGIESIFKHGPNNEMYLPMNFGISFSYTVNDSDWTLQLGAKAVTAKDDSKSITIYAKSRSTGTYTEVKTIELSSTTDMYYDLTSMLGNYDTVGKTYDIIIISNSEFANNEFASLTTVKHAGITLS